MYDVKIVNGTMISGAEGEQPWPGCVAVKDRRIAVLGRDISGPARQTLDAAGQARIHPKINAEQKQDDQQTVEHGRRSCRIPGGPHGHAYV